jgi:hypothetical protein
MIEWTPGWSFLLFEFTLIGSPENRESCEAGFLPAHAVQNLFSNLLWSVAIFTCKNVKVHERHSSEVQFLKARTSGGFPMLRNDNFDDPMGIAREFWCFHVA